MVSPFFIYLCLCHLSICAPLDPFDISLPLPSASLRLQGRGPDPRQPKEMKKRGTRELEGVVSFLNVRCKDLMPFREGEAETLDSFMLRSHTALKRLFGNLKFPESFSDIEAAWVKFSKFFGEAKLTLGNIREDSRKAEILSRALDNYFVKFIFFLLESALLISAGRGQISDSFSTSVCKLVRTVFHRAGSEDVSLYGLLGFPEWLWSREELRGLQSKLMVDLPGRSALKMMKFCLGLMRTGLEEVRGFESQRPLVSHFMLLHNFVESLEGNWCREGKEHFQHRKDFVESLKGLGRMNVASIDHIPILQVGEHRESDVNPRLKSTLPLLLDDDQKELERSELTFLQLASVIVSDGSRLAEACWSLLSLGFLAKAGSTGDSNTAEDLRGIEVKVTQLVSFQGKSWVGMVEERARIPFLSVFVYFMSIFPDLGRIVKLESSKIMKKLEYEWVFYGEGQMFLPYGRKDFHKVILENPMNVRSWRSEEPILAIVRERFGQTGDLLRLARCNLDPLKSTIERFPFLIVVEPLKMKSVLLSGLINKEKKPCFGCRKRRGSMEALESPPSPLEQEMMEDVVGAIVVQLGLTGLQLAFEGAVRHLVASSNPEGIHQLPPWELDIMRRVFIEYENDIYFKNKADWKDFYDRLLEVSLARHFGIQHLSEVDAFSSEDWAALSVVVVLQKVFSLLRELFEDASASESVSEKMREAFSYSEAYFGVMEMRVAFLYVGGSTKRIFCEHFVQYTEYLDTMGLSQIRPLAEEVLPESTDDLECVSETKPAMAFRLALLFLSSEGLNRVGERETSGYRFGGRLASRIGLLSPVPSDTSFLGEELRQKAVTELEKHGVNLRLEDSDSNLYGSLLESFPGFRHLLTSAFVTLLQKKDEDYSTEVSESPRSEINDETWSVSHILG